RHFSSCSSPACGPTALRLGLAFGQEREKCSTLRPRAVSAAAQERGAGAGGVGQGQQVEGRSDGGGSVGQTRPARERGHTSNEADAQGCQERAAARTATQPPSHRSATSRRGANPRAFAGVLFGTLFTAWRLGFVIEPEWVVERVAVLRRVVPARLV